jgi:hypothetical protein
LVIVAVGCDIGNSFTNKDGGTSRDDRFFPDVSYDHFKNERLEENIDKNDYLSEIISKVTLEMITTNAKKIVEFGPRVTGTPACKATGEYIYQTFKEQGIPSVQYHEWSTPYFESRNVIGEIPGEVNPENKIYIIGAHYDSANSVSPGADDNASGTAAVIAAAQILSKYRFKHTIRFIAFSGEEQNVKGSKAYVEEAKEKNENIIAALIADSIAFVKKPEHANQVRIGITSKPKNWISDFIIEVNARRNIGFEKIIPQNYRGSDHRSFYYKGYDAVVFVEVYQNPALHKQTDTFENMNLEYNTKVARLIIATLAEMAEPIERR